MVHLVDVILVRSTKKNPTGRQVTAQMTFDSNAVLYTAINILKDYNSHRYGSNTTAVLGHV